MRLRNPELRKGSRAVEVSRGLAKPLHRGLQLPMRLGVDSERLLVRAPLWQASRALRSEVQVIENAYQLVNCVLPVSAPTKPPLGSPSKGRIAPASATRKN